MRTWLTNADHIANLEAENARLRAALIAALEELRAGNYITAHGLLSDFMEER